MMLTAHYYRSLPLEGTAQACVFVNSSNEHSSLEYVVHGGCGDTQMTGSIKHVF